MNDESEKKPGFFYKDIATPDLNDSAVALFVQFEEADKINQLFSFDGIPYVRFRSSEKVITTPVRSSRFKHYLMKLALDFDGRIKGKETIEKVFALAESMAMLERKPIRLYNRVAKGEDCIWFDLSNDKGEVVKITTDSWKIEFPEKPLFIYLPHQKPAVHPRQVNPSDLKVLFEKFFSLVNTDPDGRLLHLVELIFAFVPDVPHPISLFYGEQGSAKSSFTAILKTLVDPSKVEVVKLSSKADRVEQSLSTHWFVPFDNVSRITSEQSDLLCIAATGGHTIKRKLYTDGEDYIVRLDSVVSLNGINVAATRPDLLDRCILHELPAIPERKRLIKSHIMASFEEVAPDIMGAIFTTLSKAMNLYPKHAERKDLPRMADFQAWGCAIIEALGIDPENFVKQYQKNIAIQNEAALSGHLIGGLLLEFLEERLPEETSTYKTTATDLLQDLELLASDRMLRDKWFPKASPQLSKELVRLKATLRGIGIIFDIGGRTTKSRSLEFRRTHEDTKLTDEKDDGWWQVTDDGNDGNDSKPTTYTADEKRKEGESINNDTSLSSCHPQVEDILKKKFPRLKRKRAEAILKLFVSKGQTISNSDIQKQLAEIYGLGFEDKIAAAIMGLMESGVLMESKPGLYRRAA